MKVLANGNAGSSVRANHRLFFVGSDSAVDTCWAVNASDPGVACASVCPYMWLAGSYERSEKVTDSVPSGPYAAHGNHWSLTGLAPPSATFAGADQVAP